MNFLDSLFNDIASVDIDKVNINNIDNVVDQTKSENAIKATATASEPKFERLMSSKKGILSPFALRHEEREKEEPPEEKPHSEPPKRKIAPKDVDDMIFLDSLYDEVDEGEEYHKKKIKEEEKQKREDIEKSLVPEDYIYEKMITCPVCGIKFKTLSVRNSKIQLLTSELNLRPVSKPIQTYHYDVVICSKCGYSGLLNYFGAISQSQSELIASNIKPEEKFRYKFAFISPEYAIERYRHLLLNSAVKKAKASEKANYCLKISWIYSEIRDTENEMKFAKSAYQGYLAAYKNENFPLFANVDESTALYLLAVLAYKFENYADSKRHLSALVARRNIPEKIKDKVEKLKELLKKG